MTTTNISANQASGPSAPAQTPEVTVGWILKRSALWAAIMALAVFSACLLYAAASKAGSETDQTAKPAAAVVKV